MSVVPLIPGDSGWQEPSLPPTFEPIVLWDGPHEARRWPSAIRILGKAALPYLKAIPEAEAWAALRELMEDSRRRTLGHGELIVKEGDYKAYVEDWLCSAENRLLRRWWKSFEGWRSPREYTGYRALESRNKLPHFEPAEVARFKLPDDISLDEDVMLFQAWCQGLQVESVLHLYRPAEHKERIREGHYRFATSPWIMFAIAAPLMEPTGILFGEHGYLQSCKRLETLLRLPFTATTGELEVIFRSPSFLAARERAKKLRASGDYWSPNGNWYVGGRFSFLPLRRGGEWTKASAGKRKSTLAAKRHLE